MNTRIVGQNIHEDLLPNTESFYSNLNIEDIGKANYEHVRIVWSSSEMTKFMP